MDYSDNEQNEHDPDTDWIHQPVPEDAEIAAQQEAARLIAAEVLGVTDTDPNEALIAGKYTIRQLNEMQMLGVPKPDDVSDDVWEKPKELSFKHKYMVQLFATGMTNKEVAQEMDLSESWVAHLRNKESVKAEVALLHKNLVAPSVQERFNKIVTKAISRAEDIMDDPETKDALVADIAFRFMDRALGKPKQTVDVETNLLSELLTRLDQKTVGSREAIPVESSKDEVDAFVEGFVPENYKIGERIVSDE